MAKGITYEDLQNRIEELEGQLKSTQLFPTGLQQEINEAADRIEDLEKQLEALRGLNTVNERLLDERNRAVNLLKTIKWKSIDKDNMEFQATITCWQHDMIAAIKDSM